MDNKVKLGGLALVIAAALGCLVWFIVRQAAPPPQQPIAPVGGRTATPPPMTPITTP